MNFQLLLICSVVYRVQVLYGAPPPIFLNIKEEVNKGWKRRKDIFVAN
jgi:hypothetical protein